MTAVAALGRVPISFTVDRVCDVLPPQHGIGGFVWSERTIQTPYVKDYDGIDGEGPAHWAGRFDLSNWGFIQAESNETLIGGVVIAFRTANEIQLLWYKDVGRQPDTTSSDRIHAR